MISGVGFFRDVVLPEICLRQQFATRAIRLQGEERDSYLGTLNQGAIRACESEREPVWPGAQDRIHQDRFDDPRSEEHTSELQSLMRISYAVFCLKKKTK